MFLDLTFARARLISVHEFDPLDEVEAPWPAPASRTDDVKLGGVHVVDWIGQLSPDTCRSGGTAAVPDDDDSRGCRRNCSEEDRHRSWSRGHGVFEAGRAK
jgi:hypothetical protein